jgi:hypothetical protein
VRTFTGKVPRSQASRKQVKQDIVRWCELHPKRPIAVALRVMYFILVVLHFDESLWVFLGAIVHAAEISKRKKYQRR